MSSGIIKNIFLLYVAISLLLPVTSHAQNKKNDEIPLDHFYVKRQKRIFRLILSKLTWGLSLGYGNTFMQHKLDRFILHQGAQGGPDIMSGKNNSRYRNWINRFEQSDSPIQSGDFLLDTDTSTMTFSGNSTAIPITLTLHYTFNRYRIGIGYTYEYLNIGSFRPDRYADRINVLQPTRSTGSLSRYFALLGVSFYRWQNLLFTADVEVGGIMLGDNFARDFINAGIYVNGGLRAEYEFSEYINIFLRPSFEFKSYKLASPEGGGEILHNMNAFYFCVGLTYRLPKLPRCFHPSCHVQIDHAHGNKEYRSRVHPPFKKQNPGYGENYRMAKATKEKYENKYKKQNPR